MAIVSSVSQKMWESLQKDGTYIGWRHFHDSL